MNVDDVDSMGDKQHNPDMPSLPPRLPQDRQELERAITLLGNRKQAELSKHARHELERLIGVYPTLKEATRWKRILRQHCKGIN